MQKYKVQVTRNERHAKNMLRQRLQNDNHVILFWIVNCLWRTSITCCIVVDLDTV